MGLHHRTGALRPNGWEEIRSVKDSKPWKFLGIIAILLLIVLVAVLAAPQP